MGLPHFSRGQHAVMDVRDGGKLSCRSNRRIHTGMDSRRMEKSVRRRRHKTFAQQQSAEAFKVLTVIGIGMVLCLAMLWWVLQ